jgi:NAD(P)H-dependent FMN reductase
VHRYGNVAILAISGSLRRGSSNTALVEALARLAPDSVDVSIYRELGELPPSIRTSMETLRLLRLPGFAPRCRRATRS